ncbi:holocytochrome c synthase [Neisseria macacae ATCC 33926]|uniref:Holocytochrome c synthase n=1 Tax=Neisseria macacae ATCC 33926 TaxID=997348 RepID=A0AA36XLQ4_9NEIS|nr:holocytochrome c synthase [Neisseria macacae ATCC 33926]
MSAHGLVFQTGFQAALRPCSLSLIPIWFSVWQIVGFTTQPTC